MDERKILPKKKTKVLKVSLGIFRTLLFFILISLVVDTLLANKSRGGTKSVGLNHSRVNTSGKCDEDGPQVFP